MPKRSSLRITDAGSATETFEGPDLAPLHVVPLVPEDMLRRHKALVPTDNRFRSAARFLQALWREDRELPIGSYVDAEGKRVRLGSRITEVSGRQGDNFLSPEIAALVRRESVYREIGAMIEVDRLRENLLSSMPLTFNLFAPLKLDLRQATRFVAELFPGLMHEVRAIKFEHSPGRGRMHYTQDYTAFDLAIYGLSPTGERAVIAIEVKYSESANEPIPSRISDRQLALSATGALYLDCEDPALFENPHQQLTRELNLAQSLLDNRDVDTALFVLASPRLNHLTQAVGESFVKLLNPTTGRGQARFTAVTLERMLEALASIGMVSHAHKLHRRYFDFNLVDGELELEAAEQRAQHKPKATAADTPKAIAS